LTNSKAKNLGEKIKGWLKEEKKPIADLDNIENHVKFQYLTDRGYSITVAMPVRQRYIEVYSEATLDDKIAYAIYSIVDKQDTFTWHLRLALLYLRCRSIFKDERGDDVGIDGRFSKIILQVPIYYDLDYQGVTKNDLMDAIQRVVSGMAVMGLLLNAHNIDFQPKPDGQRLNRATETNHDF
jgi:hypothetical protein